ncbi:MAG: HPP family protein [Thermoplasmatota archaeon]
MKPLFDRKLDKDTMKHYVFQSLLAGISLFLALQLPFIEDFVLIAAIGSTAFIVFAMPSSRTSEPRNVLGGHFVCGLIGLALTVLYPGYFPLKVVISLGVGLAVFAMVILDVEHPPAGGTVIFLILNPIMQSFIALLLLASILSLISYLLRPYMRDLV